MLYPNPGPLVSEATALPTVPPPLPLIFYIFFFLSSIVGGGKEVNDLKPKFPDSIYFKFWQFFFAKDFSLPNLPTYLTTYLPR